MDDLSEKIATVRLQWREGKRLEKPQRLFWANLGLKWCWQCSPPKPRPFDDFSQDVSNKDGLGICCKECISRKHKKFERCPDCGENRKSIYSANRCLQCHKLRAFARREFVKFKWPRDFYQEAYLLLRTWNIPWPEAEKRLKLLAVDACGSMLEAAKDFNWYQHVSIEESWADSDRPRLQLRQGVFPSPDAFIDEE